MWFVPTNPAYGLLMLAGLAAATLVWQRLRTTAHVPAAVFLGGLLGAVFGAKLAFWVLEWPLQAGTPAFWPNFFVGRTVLGALLGGYGGVEIAKRCVGYTQATGDSFAVVAPLAIFFGRIGCTLHGCCLGVACDAAWWTVRDAAGVARWPAPLAEAGFNLAFAGLAYVAVTRRVLPGQLFHVYLAAYGAFRFGHEYLRETPRWVTGFGPYHALALATCVFGVVRYVQRARAARAIQPRADEL